MKSSAKPFVVALGAMFSLLFVVNTVMTVNCI